MVGLGIMRFCLMIRWKGPTITKCTNYIALFCFLCRALNLCCRRSAVKKFKILLKHLQVKSLFCGDLALVLDALRIMLYPL